MKQVNINHIGCKGKNTIPTVRGFCAKRDDNNDVCKDCTWIKVKFDEKDLVNINDINWDE